MASPFDRDCKWCNRRITMRPMWYGWNAFEGNKKHNCPMRPDRKSTGWGSVAWRLATSKMERRGAARVIFAVCDAWRVR